MITGYTRSFLSLLLLLTLPLTALTAKEQNNRQNETEWTPLGAERQGNATGSIPSWKGGITKPPSGFKPGMRHIDPFPEDKPLFTINAANLAEHRQHLSAGQIALLEAYPDTWYMNIYRTRRSASYPDWVYDAVQQNAQTAELVTKGKGGVLNARISSPFPFPANGLEAIWNHNLRFRGISITRTSGIAAVTKRGNYKVVLNRQELAIPYAGKKAGAFKKRYPNVMMALKAKTIQPALLSGNGALTIEPINQTRDPRKSWLYNRNLKRVVRVFAEYDFPSPSSDNLRTVDEFELFFGAPDRFQWTLLGKKELYLPYNAYRLHSGEYGHQDILQQRHINPELARYELHRVWVVEGQLKPGMRHIYSRRVFYLDEDSWQIGIADNYDMQGKFWRTAEAHAMNYYEVPVQWSTLDVFYDLKAERYLVNGLDNSRHDYQFSEKGDPREFSPNALLYYVR